MQLPNVPSGCGLVIFTYVILLAKPRLRNAVKDVNHTPAIIKVKWRLFSA